MFPNFPEILKIPKCIMDPMPAYPLVRTQDSLASAHGCGMESIAQWHSQLFLFKLPDLEMHLSLA